LIGKKNKKGMAIYKLSAILHDIRETTGLMLTDYALAEYYAFRSLGGPFKEPKDVTANLLGMTSTQVSKSQKTLIREGYLEVKNNELFVGNKWNQTVRIAQAGQPVNPKAKELAKEFLVFLLKELNDANVKGAPRPNPNNKVTLKACQVRIDAILRQMPSLSATDLKMVAAWAVDYWGKKPDLVEYIRYETLLRSHKSFLDKLAKANTHFENKK
jgi:hypothetical protein